MKKVLIIIIVTILFIIGLAVLGCFVYKNVNDSGKNKDTNIKVTGKYENTYIKDTKEYKSINISDVKNVEIIKFTEGGRESDYVEDPEQIKAMYTSLGNIKILTKNDMRAEDNTAIYKFNTEDNSVSYEFEYKNIIINNQGYSYKGHIKY